MAGQRRSVVFPRQYRGWGLLRLPGLQSGDCGCRNGGCVSKERSRKGVRHRPRNYLHSQAITCCEYRGTGPLCWKRVQSADGDKPVCLGMTAVLTDRDYYGIIWLSRSHERSLTVNRCIGVVLIVGLLAALAVPAAVAANTPEDLEDAFALAASEFHVPVEILKALSWVESRWSDHDGQPSVENGYGVMHLAENAHNRSLVEAAELLSVSPEVLKQDCLQNVRGGAAVLQAIQENLGIPPSDDPAQWYQAVAAYCHAADPWVAKSFADEVFEVLQKGMHGERVTLQARGAITPCKGPTKRLPQHTFPEHRRTMPIG